MAEFDHSHLIAWGLPSQQARVTIHNDGHVTFAEGVTIDQASREFWDAVQEMGLSQAAFWETAATRNGELYSGAENQRDDLREAIARVRALHRKATHGPDCAYCMRGNNSAYDVTWPCDTIRALDGQAS